MKEQEKKGGHALSRWVRPSLPNANLLCYDTKYGGGGQKNLKEKVFFEASANTRWRARK